MAEHLAPDSLRRRVRLHLAALRDALVRERLRWGALRDALVRWRSRLRPRSRRATAARGARPPGGSGIGRG